MGMFSFNQNAGETPETIARKRQIAQAMMQQGTDTSAIQHPLQGVARIAQALSGNWANSRLDRAEKGLKDEAEGKRKAASDSFSKVVASLMGGQPQTPPAGNVAQPGMAPMAPGGDTFQKMIQVESGGNPNAVSPKGATGIAQVMPATARDPGFGLPNIFDFAKKQGVQVADNSDATLQALLKNPQVNAGFGEAYFNAQKQRYGGDERLAAAAYNAGPGAVDKAGGVPNIQETQDYVRKLGLNGNGPMVQNLPYTPQPGAAALQTLPDRPVPGAASIQNLPQGGQQPQIQPAGYQQPQQQQPQPAAVQQAGQLPMEQILGLVGDPSLNQEQQGILAAVVKQKLATGEWTKLNDGTMFNNMTGQTQKVDVPQDAFTLNPGDVRFGPDGKPIANVPALPKEQAKPAAIQEYEFAKSQGFPGTFQDWEASKKGGMALSVDPATGQVTFQQGNNIKPMTEGQSKDTVYATRAEGALKIFDEIESGLTGQQGVVGSTVGQLPGVGNFLKSGDFQRAEQAGAEFLQAVLRKDTGAAITPGEQALYGETYLPRPGDTPEVMAQKKAARQRAIAAINAGMPPQAILAKEQALAKGGQPQAAPAQGQKRMKFNPETGELE